MYLVIQIHFLNKKSSNINWNWQCQWVCLKQLQQVEHDFKNAISHYQFDDIPKIANVVARFVVDCICKTQGKFFSQRAFFNVYLPMAF